MTLAPRLPFPVAQWVEPPIALTAVALVRMYWHYDALTDEWTLTDDASLASGTLADLAGDGLYSPALFSAIPFGTSTRRATASNGLTLFY